MDNATLGGSLLVDLRATPQHSLPGYSSATSLLLLLFHCFRTVLNFLPLLLPFSVLPILALLLFRVVARVVERPKLLPLASSDGTEYNTADACGGQVQ